MTTTLNDQFSTIELIPPNPAAIDFEQQFRANLQSFLSGMLSFETEYLSTVLDLKGGDANLDLSTAITDIKDGADHAKEQILNALITGNGSASASWDYNGSTVLVGGNPATGLDYASLSDRFTAIDTAVADRALTQDFNNLKNEVDAAHDTNFSGDTLLQRFQRIEAKDSLQDDTLVNAFSLIGDGSSSVMSNAPMSIEERFYRSEDVLKKAYSVKQDTTGSSADTTTAATSIENRFSLIEDQLASTGSSLANYALLAGDTGQNFSAQDLTVASNINFTGTSATLTGLQTASINDLSVIDLYVQSHLTLNNDPTLSDHAIRLSYADTNFAKITGLNTQTFEVLTDDSQANAADQAINKAYADGRFAPIAGAAGNPFEASTLKLNGALDMNSNLINNLTDPVNAQDAVTLNYLQNNYTDSNDLGTNYAAIGGSNTENFEIQKLTVHDDVDMNSQFITNLPDPTGTGHAVNYDYLTTNYTDNNTLALTYAGINGATGQAFDVLDPNDDTDADQDTWAISRAYADGRYAKQGGDAAINFNADTLTANSLLLGGSLDMQNNQIVNLPTPLSTDTADVNVNKGYVDTVKSTLLSMITTGSVPPFNVSSQDGLFLAVTSAGLNWVAPPDFDPAVNPYDWLRHPQVSFETLQFDGVIYANTTLLAGFTYFVAGDLELPDTNPDGTPCTSVLTVMGGASTQRGATLIVQGHIKGDISRLTLDTFNTNAPKLIVQDWADSNSDYVIKGTVNTSDLNLEGPKRYSCRLVLEDNAILNIDSNCQLVFREEVLGTGSVINQTTGTVDYFDPMLIVKDAPLAMDTLKEISDFLGSSGSGAGTVISRITDLETEVSDAGSTDLIITRVQNIETAIGTSGGAGSISSRVSDLETSVQATYGTSSAPSLWSTLEDADGNPITFTDPTSLIDRIDQGDQHIYDQVDKINTMIEDGVFNSNLQAIQQIDSNGNTTVIYSFKPEDSQNVSFTETTDSSGVTTRVYTFSSTI